jgi:hypothetical protein
MNLPSIHEFVGVIKRSCYAQAGFAVQPTLLVVGLSESDSLLMSVIEELVLDDAMRVLVWRQSYPLRGDDERTSICLASSSVIFAAQNRAHLFEDGRLLQGKSVLDWDRVKRDSQQLFWPAYSVMDFFIVNQEDEKRAASNVGRISQEGEER